jgi:hypothetical protein
MVPNAVVGTGEELAELFLGGKLIQIHPYPPVSVDDESIAGNGWYRNVSVGILPPAARGRIRRC